MNLLVNVCHWALFPAKLLVECALYVVSFCVQRLFIFK